MKKFGLTLVFLFVIGYLAFLGWKIYSALQEAENLPETPTAVTPAPVAIPEPEEPKTVVESSQNTFTTNPEYRESEETQVMWMKRGQNIALERFAGANRAEFRNTFYHRGFTYKPVACGEIQTWRDEQLIEDFQRFIFAGTKLAYFENQVENFDVFWDKMCVESQQDPLP